MGRRSGLLSVCRGLGFWSSGFSGRANGGFQLSDLQQVLEAFKTPSTSAVVAQRLGWSERLVEGLLRQLEARGLVIPAEPGWGECSTGCGFCSMQSFCPKSDEEEEQDPDPVSQNPPVWRLTSVGQSTIGRRKNSVSQAGSAG